MDITLSMTGAFRETGASFFIPKGALTHHLVVTSSISLALPQSGRSRSFRCSSSPHKAGFAGTPVRRWYPSRWSGRALFPKHPPDASPEGADNAAVFQTVVIACAAGRRPLPRLPLCSKPLSPSETSCHPPAKTCRWQLYRSYGRCIPNTVHFLLPRQKKQKRLPAGAERT